MSRNAKLRPFRLTIVHPCVGRHAGMKKYIRTWMMEPLPAAIVAALVPPDVEKRFYDDRLEPVPYDEPTDLVALSVETYTARRAYQIASDYRRRGVPVVMGGFHATLRPDEVMQHCESIVLGEAEEIFPRVIDDYRHGRPEKIYSAPRRPVLGTGPARPVDLPREALPAHQPSSRPRAGAASSATSARSKRSSPQPKTTTRPTGWPRRSDASAGPRE